MYPLTRMRHITSDELVTALVKMVQTKGEGFIYTDQEGGQTQCQYVHLENDSPYRYERTYVPGCGIGQVLHDLKVIDLEILYEGNHNDEDSNGLVVHLGNTEKATFSDEAAEIMATFQGHQDHGDTWGNALKYALGGVVAPHDECELNKLVDGN